MKPGVEKVRPRLEVPTRRLHQVCNIWLHPCHVLCRIDAKSHECQPCSQSGASEAPQCKREGGGTNHPTKNLHKEHLAPEPRVQLWQDNCRHPKGEEEYFNPRNIPSLGGHHWAGNPPGCVRAE